MIPLISSSESRRHRSNPSATTRRTSSGKRTFYSTEESWIFISGSTREPLMILRHQSKRSRSRRTMLTMKLYRMRATKLICQMSASAHLMSTNATFISLFATYSLRSTRLRLRKSASSYMNRPRDTLNVSIWLEDYFIKHLVIAANPKVTLMYFKRSKIKMLLNLKYRCTTTFSWRSSQSKWIPSLWALVSVLTSQKSGCPSLKRPPSFTAAPPFRSRSWSRQTWSPTLRSRYSWMTSL